MKVVRQETFYKNNCTLETKLLQMDKSSDRIIAVHYKDHINKNNDKSYVCSTRPETATQQYFSIQAHYQQRYFGQDMYEHKND